MNHNLEISPDRIPVRKPITSLDPDIPKHWLSGDMFKSHFANTLSLLFPDAELYFIRTVKKFLPSISLERLKRDVLSFIGQEMQHHRTHEKAWKIMENQGFRIQEFLEVYKYISFQIIEKSLDEKTNLAVVSGLEHFTAILSEYALENQILMDSEPNLRAVFEWHAAEELEHKHVAFDLLQSVDTDYKLRILGILIATFLFFGYSSTGILNLFLQDDPKQFLRVYKEAYDFLWNKDRAIPNIIFRYLEYFHPEFHPNHRNTKPLTDEVIRNMDFEPILNTNPANLESIVDKKGLADKESV